MWLTTTKETMTFTLRNFEIPYSLKNIPNISLFKYLKLLTYRTEDLIERMRWEVVHSKKKKDKDMDENEEEEEKNTYGFRTPFNAPKCPELKPFEDDLIKLLGEIETKYVGNPLQDQMREDLRTINSLESEVIIQSDKTSNFFIMDVNEYKGHLNKEIMKGYRKVDNNIIERIDQEAASLVARIGLDDRIEGIAKKQSFITVKDHKDDFPSKLSFRLINGAKTNLGKISKEILDRLNNAAQL